jgi:hypothetical protein
MSGAGNAWRLIKQWLFRGQMTRQVEPANSRGEAAAAWR